MDRGAWRARVLGVAKSWAELAANTFTFTFPGGSAEEIPPANAEATGEEGSIPGSGRSPVGGPDSPLQCSGLGNPVDRGD